jgi:hypothetical protein
MQMNAGPPWSNGLRCSCETGAEIQLALAALLAVSAVLFLSTADTGVDIGLEIGKTLLTLVSAVLVTGVLTFVLSQLSAREAVRREHERVLVDSLRELKTAYETIQIVRYFLAASPTALSLSQQIRVVLDARAQLHRVQRERLVRDSPADTAIDAMLTYLTQVAAEYKQEFHSITEMALQEEHARDVVRSGAGRLLPQPQLPPTAFTAVYAFIDESTWQEGEFNLNYLRAKRHLQSQLPR